MTIEIDISRYKNLALEAHDDGVWVVTLNRPTKRNALDIDTIEELVEFFSAAPRAGVRAVVLAGAGDHFCAGLDLIEHHDADRSPADFMHVCLRWHEAFNKMEYGGVPIIAALQGGGRRRWFGAGKLGPYPGDGSNRLFRVARGAARVVYRRGAQRSG